MVAQEAIDSVSRHIARNAKPAHVDEESLLKPDHEERDQEQEEEEEQLNEVPSQAAIEVRLPLVSSKIAVVVFTFSTIWLMLSFP